MFYLIIKIGNDWDNIAIIRNYIISILSKKITNYDEAYRVAIVASELMENAFKYSTGGGVYIELEQDNNKTDIEFRIKNITRKENIQEFVKIYNLVYNGSAPEVYKKMLMRVIENKNNTLSQLGLARIRYEGSSEISYEIKHDIEQLLKKNEKIDTHDLRILCVKSKMTIMLKTMGKTDGL